jgi:hypothetical protein
VLRRTADQLRIEASATPIVARPDIAPTLETSHSLLVGVRAYLVSANDESENRILEV